jgi:hypothetical protein
MLQPSDAQFGMFSHDVCALLVATQVAVALMGALADLDDDDDEELPEGPGDDAPDTEVRLV